MLKKKGVRVKWASHNIYNLFRVSLFHSDETFMCMHAQEVLFSNKTYKNPLMFLKNDCKKLFSLQNVIKKLSASPKNGNPPPPPPSDKQ